MNRFRCNICDAEFPGKKGFIAHSRSKHPDGGYSLWDAIGTTGDAFADSAVKHYQDANRESANRIQDAEAKSKNYERLVRKYDVLIRFLQIIKPALDGAVEEVNRE